MTEVCVVAGATTTCEYTQSIPLAVVDWPLVAGLAVVISIMVAQFVRYVFFR